MTTRSHAITVPSTVEVWMKFSPVQVKIDRAKVIQTIRDAATFLEGHRWNRGAWLNSENGSVCAMGAVDSVVSGLYGYKYNGEQSTWGAEAKGFSTAIHGVLSEEVENTDPTHNDIIEWNDDQRDKRKVVRLFRRAADAAERGVKLEALEDVTDVLDGAIEVLETTKWRCGPGNPKSGTACLMQAVALGAGRTGRDAYDNYALPDRMGPAEMLACVAIGEAVIDVMKWDRPTGEETDPKYFADQMGLYGVSYNDNHCHSEDDAIRILESAKAKVPTLV